MTALEAAPARQPARSSATARIALAGLAVGLFLLALAPRAVGTGLFATPDEDLWLHRSSAFRLALERGDWRDTYRSGHPGVTTMWLASFGARPWAESLTRYRQNTIYRAPDFMAALEAARRPILLVNAILVAALGLLAWRLFGPGPALFCGLLLALDPFLVAYSQQVHLDALLAGFMALALLAALVRWTAGGGRVYLVLCGLASGLALLTKTPAAFLFGAVPLIALVGHRFGPAGPGRGRLAAELLSWAGLAGLTALLLWPALLVNPVETLREAASFTEETSQRAREANTFLLGTPRTDAGPLFYPLTLLFRLTPAALLGLVAALGLWSRSATRSPAALLLLCSLGFGLALALSPKKFDRYLLPSVVLLDLLAGLGLWQAWRALREGRLLLAGLLRRWPAALALPLGAALLVGTVWPLQAVAPHYLSYYNPLLGGGPAAVRTVPVGRGEGFDQVAAFINAQPDGAQARVAIFFEFCVPLNPLLQGTALRDDEPRGATYYVEYVNARQRQRPIRLPLVEPPLQTVWLNGIEYARIYRVAGAAAQTPPRPACDR